MFLKISLTFNIPQDSCLKKKREPKWLIAESSSKQKTSNHKFKEEIQTGSQGAQLDTSSSTGLGTDFSGCHGNEEKINTDRYTDRNLGLGGLGSKLENHSTSKGQHVYYIELNRV